MDDGAARALIDGGRSLLAVGIADVEGDFAAGAAVEIQSSDGRLIGKGLVGMDAAELSNMRGRHSSEAGGAAVHRDDLVVLR